MIILCLHFHDINKGIFLHIKSSESNIFGIIGWNTKHLWIETVNRPTKSVKNLGGHPYSNTWSHYQVSTQHENMSRKDLRDHLG